MQIDIGIKEEHRDAVASGLKHVLADSYALYFKTHGFHWNVTGPMFNTLHTMFETQYTELWQALDEIAERIRALGLYAPQGAGALAELSSLPDGEPTLDAMEMVRQLVRGHEAVARTIRKVYPAAEEGGDEATLDLLTQRLRVHEKTAWMLRAVAS